jgi:hypothetical protein
VLDPELLEEIEQRPRSDPENDEPNRH